MPLYGGKRWTPSRRVMGIRSEAEQPSGTKTRGGILPKGVARGGRIGFTAPDSTGRNLAPTLPYQAPTRINTANVPGIGAPLVPTAGGTAVPGVNTLAGAPGGAGGDLGTPLTGFGQPFLPGAVPMLYDNPELLAMQAMSNLGYGDLAANQGLYQMIRPQMEYANWLAGLALGQGSDLGAGGNNAALNWIGNYAQNLMTPGGNTIDFNAGLNALRAGIGTPNSAISQFLNVDDPAAQVANFKSLALPLAAAGLHPFFARAFQNAVNQAGDQYLLSAATNAGAGNFGAFFGAQTPYI